MLHAQTHTHTHTHVKVIRCHNCQHETLSTVVGGVFSKTEMSEVLTEVVRMDPTFDKEDFIKLCRFDIIPNILEVINWLTLYVVLNCVVEFVIVKTQWSLYHAVDCVCVC